MYTNIGDNNNHDNDKDKVGEEEQDEAYYLREEQALNFETCYSLCQITKTY